MMYLINHGGKCCGIKTIHELGMDIVSMEPAIAKAAERNKDDVAYNDPGQRSFFTDAAPHENREARLRRFVDFVAKWRPSHLIEINLNMSETWIGQRCWLPVLEDLGFKKVSEFKNSNSSYQVGVFHLILLNGEVVK